MCVYIVYAILAHREGRGCMLTASWVFLTVRLLIVIFIIHCPGRSEILW